MRLFVLLFIIFAQLSCISFVDKKYYVKPHIKRGRADFCASSTDGMVASAHPEASRIGKEILLKGGNAVDAAVATSFAISVLRPQSSGLGGGGFMLVYKDSKETKAFDFRERAPQKASATMYLDKDQIKKISYKNKIITNPSVNGHLAVATPGLVAGLIKAHDEYGILPLSLLIEPAIKIAEEGFEVYEELATACKEREDILSIYDDSAKIFLPQGKPLALGEKLRQTDLAWTLRQIASHKAQAFYDGSISEKLIEEIKSGGGIVSKDDLKNYEVKIREPLKARYRGHTIVSMPPPSSGGIHIIEMLNILSHFDLKSMGHDSVQKAHIMAETMKRAFADRALYLGDPDFVDIPMAKILSPKHSLALARTISLTQATPAHELNNSNFEGLESPSTTHISVVDKNGMAVSTTQTINYTFGSGVVARGTGIVLNDEMDDFSIKPNTPNVYGLVGNKANAISAKKTMLSSMSPTLVFDNNNNLELVLGSPGGPRIINATLQTIVNFIDHDMSLADAVHSYRIHHQWLPDIITIEPHSLGRKNIKKLKDLGHNFNTIKNIGDVQAIQVIHKDKNISFIGVSDTRSCGKPY
jgi:gamma-glutamyltranspeptidase/glutathione hydrolase